MTGLPAVGIVLALAAIAFELARRHAARLRRSRARLEAMGPNAVAASLRPSGGHVEAAPAEPPITTNGRRV